MKRFIQFILPVFILVLFFLAGLGLAGCGTTSPSDQGLSVSVYLTEETLPRESRDIKLVFNKEIDPATIPGNIVLSDTTGSLESHYTLELYSPDASGKTVLIKLNDDFELEESWLYMIRITRGLKSTAGETLSADTDLEIITSSHSPILLLPGSAPDTDRTKTVIISDIHMGEERAATAGYCWFTDNSALLESFLDEIAASSQVKELVIAGDFFDEWVIPMEVQPFQPGISSDEGYFLSVANAPLNRNIIAKLNEIADGGQIKVIYVPGNHDMLMTEAILREIIPNIEWHGQDSTTGITAGNGEYWPEAAIAIEHGHRYDFFNSPDAPTRPGSLLPPGFFISRVFASKMIQGTVAESPGARSADIEFAAAWDIAIAAIGLHGLDKDAPIIKTGINGYNDLMSVNGAKANYSPQIGDQWDSRQEINGVYSKMDEWTAILTGSGVGWWGDLQEPAEFQYLIPKRARIIAFGHSHKGMIKKALLDSARIYANSGTWVNASQVASGYATRTYLVINSAAARGAEVDTVTLYQYNGRNESTQLAEQTIKY